MFFFYFLDLKQEKGEIYKYSDCLKPVYKVNHIGSNICMNVKCCENSVTWRMSYKK
jgi:hypothetical protein